MKERFLRLYNSEPATINGFIASAISIFIIVSGLPLAVEAVLIAFVTQGLAIFTRMLVDSPQTAAMKDWLLAEARNNLEQLESNIAVNEVGATNYEI